MFLFFTMSVKNRKFSLDSSIPLDSVIGARRSSCKFGNKKFCQTQSLDDARQQIQELSQSLSTNMSIREQTIMEESIDRSDGLVTNNSFLKHNKTFHKLFQELPEGENLTHTFTCSLQKEGLYHGKLFVSENYVCFYSSVLLKDTKVVIPVSSVRHVKKQNSALSMLSIQTADGEKYSFVSLRNRGMCYKLLQTVCSIAPGESANNSPHMSSAENEADLDMISSNSSVEDSIYCKPSRQNSSDFDNGFPQFSSEAPSIQSSTRQNSLVDEDNKDWIWRIADRVTPFFSLREIRNLSVLFYIYLMLLVLLLLASGYIGLRIIALEEQLNSLGALTELTFHHREYQET